MTRSAHQPSNLPGPGWGEEGAGGRRGWRSDDEGAEGRERKEKGESGIRSDREGRGERAGEGVLPSNMLALMAQTALTFNH